MNLRFMGILSLFIVFSSLGWVEAETQDTITIRDFIDKAKRAESRYLYADALSWYEKALALDADNPDLLVGKAKQLIGLERLEEAQVALLKAVQLNPTHAEAHTMLGVYYQKFANDFDAAEKHIRLAILADPHYVRPQELLGEFLVSLQRIDEAQEVYEHLCENVPEAFEGHFGLGSVLVKRNRNDEAVVELKHAIELRPSDPEPYRFLGQALSKIGQREEAQAYLKQYQERKDNQNKLTQLLRSVRRNPNTADHWFKLGGFYLRNQEQRNAIQAFEHGLELDPNRNTFYGYLGVMYLQLKEITPAQHYLEQAVKRDPKNPENYNNLGVCFMLQKDYARAAENLKQSLDLGNKDPRVEQNYQAALRKMLQPPSSSNEKQ